MDRRLRLALGVLAALLVLWGAGWFVVARIVESRAADWIERERALGNRLVYRNLGVEGFPFAWRLVATEYEIGREMPVAQVLSGARLEAWLVPWNLADVPMRFPGKHRYERREPTKLTAIELEAVRPEARMRLHPNGRIREIDVDLGDATARTPGAAASETTRARRVRVVAREVDPVDPRSREFFNVAITLDELVPPGSWQPPFNRPLKSGEAVIGVRGERVRNPNAAEQLVAWRNSGGLVQLHSLRLDWAPLMISGDGTGGLDQANRPQGALGFRVIGAAELIDSLVATGQIRQGQAVALKVSLAAATRVNPETKQSEVRISVSAQDGRLWAGLPDISRMPAIPLIALPPIQMPVR